MVGALLGILKPWDAIADHLKRDKKDLMKTMEATVKRRNDIVHRADRPQSDPSGPAQEITYAWTKHAVDTIEHICLTMDELVTNQVQELKAYLEA